jgi:hypothetical protein
VTARFTIQEAEGGLIARLEALPARLKDVTQRAVTAVTDWAGDAVADRVATVNQIPRAVVFAPRGRQGGPRVFVRLPRARDGSAKGSVWVGGQPVPAQYLGTAVQTPEGVQVGTAFFYEAFLARMRNGHVGVFQRAVHLTRHSAGRPVTWQPNLPILPVTVDLDTAGPVRQVQALIPGQLEAAVQAALEAPDE